jgi:hypothetical protein
MHRLMICCIVIFVEVMYSCHRDIVELVVDVFLGLIIIVYGLITVLERIIIGFLYV